MSYGEPVYLCLYDLQVGSFFAKLFDKNAGHYTIRAYGYEYSQNRDGVKIERAGAHGEPRFMWRIGTTYQSEGEIIQSVRELSKATFKKYNVITANCIQFCDALGKTMPGTNFPPEPLCVVYNIATSVLMVAIDLSAITIETMEPEKKNFLYEFITSISTPDRRWSSLINWNFGALWPQRNQIKDSPRRELNYNYN